MRLLDQALQPLARTLNHVLALDPASADRLARLNGRSVAVRLTAPTLTIHIHFADGALNLALTPPGNDHTPDATVTGSAGALLALARDPEQGGEAVEFSGDLGLVRDLRGLLAKADLDWEEQIARVLGDIPAHQLGNAARGFFSWLGATRQATESGIAEYLTEESRQLPTAVEVDQFLSDIDRLRQDADRLTARVKLLERSLQPKRGGK
ncbi:MAG: SCP2 sterol-binding domain-containing protein [Aquisalimonadaceae bacterium]